MEKKINQYSNIKKPVVYMSDTECLACCLWFPLEEASKQITQQQGN